MALNNSDRYLREEIIPANNEKNESEGDLYFEMEYQEIKRSGSETPDSVSFLSKSIESFESERTHDSQECCYRDGRRESSVGPILERPSYLRLTSKFKRNISYGSLPTTSQEIIPKSGFSVPATPIEPWENENRVLRKHQSTSSTSSAEEATESLLKKARSRLSLNLGVFDVSSSTGSPARSPRFVPKFLRTSFCKLTLREKLKSQEPLADNKSSQTNAHLQDVMDVCNANSRILHEQNLDGSPPYSTKLFVQESLAKGLPIIPFNYPTFNIIEKKPSQRETQSTTNKILKMPDIPDRDDQLSSHSEPSSRKISSTKTQFTEKFSLQEKSLKKLLSLAKREMEEEANLKKNSSIRGYAANNSRALLRRRSSMTEYVGMSTEKDKSISMPSCPILERNLTSNSLVCSFSGSGRTKERKFNYQKAVDKSPNIDKNYTKRDQTECSKANEDYLDMRCGKKETDHT